MARAMHKLSARAVQHAKGGMHSDGGGLFLRVKGNARSWVCRYTWDGRKREMGLGSADVTTLTQARQKAAEARQLVAQGVDPIEVRKAPVTAPVRAPALLGTQHSFKDAMNRYLDLNAGQWKNPKYRQQWRESLVNHAAPLMTKHVGDITVDDIEAVLVPIWTEKVFTARKVRERIERVIGYGIAKKWCKGPNVATWRGNLEHILPIVKREVRHHAAVLVDEAPAAFAQLWAIRHRGIGGVALCLGILGAMRSGEIRGLRWDELRDDHILIPGSRMKAGADHRIPITPTMRKLLDDQPVMAGSDLVFPSFSGKAMDDKTLAVNMKVAGIDATQHGWRSTFSDWANGAGFRREHIEDALAHTIGSSVERAYRRGDYLDHRRDMMEAWGAFLLGIDP